MKKVFERIYIFFTTPKFTRPRNLKIFQWMNCNAVGKKVLNLGSGIGNFDFYLSKNIETINLDIDLKKPNLDIVADAHLLPFKDEAFDIVYSIATLEHVKKPWIVSEEIKRVLRTGGYVVLELPFLNMIHDEHDYFRFTDKGIQSMFDKEDFEPVFTQVSSGGGSFFSVFALNYSMQFIPTKILKRLWKASTSYLFSLFKYLDFFIDKSDSLRITANSFSYIGRKK